MKYLVFYCCINIFSLFNIPADGPIELIGMIIYVLIFSGPPHILHFEPGLHNFEALLNFVLGVLAGYIFDSQCVTLLDDLLIGYVVILLLALNALLNNVELLLHFAFFLLDLLHEWLPAHRPLELLPLAPYFEILLWELEKHMVESRVFLAQVAEQVILFWCTA